MSRQVEKVKSRTPAVPTGYTGRKVQTMRGLTSKIECVWQEVMREMAQFSSESRTVVAENSGHYIHLTDSELVAGIVDGMAAA